MGSTVNIVLVHGAWCDGSSWSRVIPLLQDAGHDVTAVQMPLSSLADDIAATRRVLERIAGPTVLVGHSYGGAVISGAATGLAQVTQLVFVAAHAPAEGEATSDLKDRFPAAPGGQFIRPDAHGYLWLDRDGFLQAFAADVDVAQGHLMAAVQKPIHGRCFADKSGPPAWRTVPSRYLVAVQDQMVAPELQRYLADRMGAKVRLVESSHVIPVSHPAEVLQEIQAAAEAALGPPRSPRPSGA